MGRIRLRIGPTTVWMVGLIGLAVFARDHPLLAVPLLTLPPLVMVTKSCDAVTLLTLYLAFLFILPSRLLVGPLGAASTPANLVGLAALAWWCLARLVPGLGAARGLQPVRVVLLLFGLAFTVSYAMAYLHLSAPIEISAANRAVAAVAALAGVCLIAADGIVSIARLEVLLRRLVAAGTFLASVGIVQFYTSYDIAALFRVPGLTPVYGFGDVPRRSTFNRVQATAIHPIEFGVVLALILPIAIHFATVAPRGRRRVPVASALVIAFALPTAVSRTAVLAFTAAGAMLFTGWSWRQRRQALSISVLFTVIVRLAVPGLLGTIRGLFSNLSSDPSVQGRTNDYAVVGTYIRPLFGRGMFTFVPDRYITLDNQYLLTVVEMGFVGLIVFLLVFLVGIFTARGARRRSVQSSTQQLALSLAASMLGGMVAAATFDLLSFPMATGVIVVTLGCIGALWRLTGREWI